MDAHERWKKIVESATAARRVEPYASYGPREWSIWATGMLSALSSQEARAIVTEVLGIPPNSREARPSALRTALISAMVGEEVLRAWTEEAERRSGTRGDAPTGRRTD
jgi:hypothetical protein